MAKKILVIDDEYGILEVVQAYLLKEGYEVFTAVNGVAGLALYERVKPDFVVLDLMLPDLSGEVVCRKIREQSTVPILMLTAKKAEEDKLSGLEIGADDYMTKPFSPKELVMRIKVILRRVSGPEQPLRSRLSFNKGDLTVEKIERTVTKAGAAVELTKNEYELLLTLVENVNRTYTREQLIETAFGFDYLAYDRTIDVYIKNLRKKLEDDIKNPAYIVTVYGVGYKFKGEADL